MARVPLDVLMTTVRPARWGYVPTSTGEFPRSKSSGLRPPSSPHRIELGIEAARERASSSDSASTMRPTPPATRYAAVENARKVSMTTVAPDTPSAPSRRERRMMTGVSTLLDGIDRRGLYDRETQQTRLDSLSDVGWNFSEPPIVATPT